MIAVIENWWKQYKVKVGQSINLEKLEGNVGDIIEIKKVMLLFVEWKEEDARIGVPFVDAVVKLKVVDQWLWDKVNVVKFKAKKRYARKYWHRQPFTKVEVVGIE